MSYPKLLLSFSCFFFFISFVSSSSSSYLNTTTPKCSVQQTLSLLLFKQSLYSINDTSYLYNRCQDWLGSGYYPIMMNWNTSSDCCNWNAVTCNPFTGDVIGIDLSCGMLEGTIYLNTTLFHLPHLQRLNLAFNNFSGSQLPREIGKFSNSLTHLNLSNTHFRGEISSEIFLLSKLVSIDLSNNFDLIWKPHFLSNLFQNCTLLEDLWLKNCELDGYLPTHINISSLKSLDLGYNNLKGRLPDNIFDLQHLEKLDLSGNFNVTGPFPKVNRSTSLPLKWLGFSDINLSGEIPDSIGYFKSLNYLDLGVCGLVGSIPKTLVNLRHLTTLYLFSNRLNGTVPSSLLTLPSIEVISLSNNKFSGVLPSEIFNCRSLKRLYLQKNQFDGLLELDTLLSTLPKLELLDLSYTGLSVVTTKATHYVNPDFIKLALASCNLTLFPESIRAMKKLQILDLSDNKIRGRIPDWAWDIGGNDLRYVDLSHNSITRLPLFKWYGVRELYLQSNQIQGPFPPSICNMSNLTSLDMSKNNFGGAIPKCLRKPIYSLRNLNLGTNQFNGTIPNVFRGCGGLSWLILNGNQLEGEAPSSLSKCQNLNILDLGNNKLNGTFPGWLGDLPYLQVLVFKSNNLHGTIATSSSSSSELPFQRLQVLDLSHNRFVGHLPQKYFQNFIAMKGVETNNTNPRYLQTSTGYYSIIVSVKGQELEFQKISVSYTIIDLSNNRFEGEIPNVIGSLNSLIVLNLSHNNLNGQIPHALGKLSSIESLDLSWNQLTGKIPQSLTDITALQVLNLSQNHLTGRVPQGKQFNTFDASSYGGNSGLYGFLLPKPSKDPASPELNGDVDDDYDEEKESGFTWVVVMLGYGSGTVIGLVLGYLMLSTGKPKWFNAIYDAAEHMILKRQNKWRYIYIGK